MQEELYKLPEPAKLAYQTLRNSVVDLDIAKRPKAILLAELDEAFLKVQAVTVEPRLPIPSRPWLSNSLVPVIETGEKLMVDARTLHTFLESKRLFQDWFKDRVEQYGWVEGVDYFVVTGTQICVPDDETRSPNLVSGGKGARDEKGRFIGADAIDYHLTLSMAKELGMVENNAMGRKIRKYFIECEERLMDYYKKETDAWKKLYEHDCDSLDWLREKKTVDKVEADALVVLRDMWREEHNARLDFISETYKENDIRHKGTAKEVLTFLRPQIKSALTRLRGAHEQLTKHVGLANNSVLVMRLEGVIEDFSFVDQWIRQPK